MREKKRKERKNSERGREGIRIRSGGVKEENMERKKKREKEVEEDRWEKYLVSQEKFIYLRSAKRGPNSFKTKSQNMTKSSGEFPQPFPHVLFRHV